MRRSIAVLGAALLTVGSFWLASPASAACAGTQNIERVCVTSGEGGSIPIDYSDCIYLADETCTPVEVHEEVPVPSVSICVRGITDPMLADSCLS